MSVVYVALGGNIGETENFFLAALQKIACLPKSWDVRCSKMYQTKPESPIAQPDFLNAVCSFKTHLELGDLWCLLQEIERSLGKVPKKKEEPRIIDLDFLFFGSLEWEGDGLTIPHPRWKERLFVLIPLLDLTSSVRIGEKIIDIKPLIEAISHEKH